MSEAIAVGVVRRNEHARSHGEPGDVDEWCEADGEALGQLVCSRRRDLKLLILGRHVPQTNIDGRRRRTDRVAEAAGIVRSKAGRGEQTDTERPVGILGSVDEATGWQREDASLIARL